MTAASTVSATALAAAAPDDTELLKLEKEIFAARHAAQVYDNKVLTLFEAWQDEARRLESEAEAGRSSLTEIERWETVIAMPEAQEHDRLAKLQRPTTSDALMGRMFDIPARTAEGRGAKVTVLLGCLIPEGWLWNDDDEEDFPICVARKLLTEFAGGAL